MSSSGDLCASAEACLPHLPHCHHLQSRSVYGRLKPKPNVSFYVKIAFRAWEFVFRLL
jgi:hypothetical protein